MYFQPSKRAGKLYQALPVRVPEHTAVSADEPEAARRARVSEAFEATLSGNVLVPGDHRYEAELSEAVTAFDELSADRWFADDIGSPPGNAGGARPEALTAKIADPESAPLREALATSTRRPGQTYRQVGRPDPPGKAAQLASPG